MDDQQTYLLNGLLTRQFPLGRILRFRQVVRGRQAVTYELLTAEQHEYVAYLYPPAFSVDALEFTAGALGKLDENRFSVVPFVVSTSGRFVAEGPQGRSLMVSLGTAGSPLPAEQYTAHDLSQVGLRLAWLHRLLREQLPVPEQPPLAEQLERALDRSAGGVPLDPEARQRLVSALALPLPVGEVGAGWAHGDIHPAALLHDADHQLRTVVDWALLHPGAALEDVVDALLTLCRDEGGGVAPGRARTLLESYDSLLPLRKVAWTAIVAHWAARRLIDAAAGRRELPGGFRRIAGAPEGLAVAIASCFS